MKFYLDSSFIVDCVYGNPVAIAIISQLDGQLFTSKLGRTETIRTVNKIGSDWIENVYQLFESIAVIDIDDEVLALVESYGSDVTLKTSDAIHVASAEFLLEEGDYLVTLDKQVALNAKSLGLKVLTSS